ncbi:PilW family protein [Parathalassolituus penaei]|uniref:PilW family protein n=1 Tax=Parathalassolituus penaei TaxID=2997323 RepID=A0A9X3EJN9_9GAMM|nr:PilW family protein [Parathalassolituus penaei]MCY0965536.1 PilW family protein [Parathalassolituus penaei]
MTVFSDKWSARAKQSGFSMIELMISMVISLVLIAGVVSVFQSNKRTYITGDALAEIQENVRIAYDYIAREVRMAGSGYSCLANVTTVQNMLNSTDFDFNFAQPLEAYDNGNNLPAALSGVVKSGTDALVVRGTYGVGAKLETELDNPSASLKVTSIDPPPMGVDDIVVVTDCRTASIFQITNFSGNGNSGSDNVVHNTGTGTPGNQTKNFIYPFQAGATVIKTRTIAYYIGTNANGESALFQRATDQGSSDTIEVVEGIQDMQLTFGVDTNDDGLPEGYYTPTQITDGSIGAEWSDAISARINLLVRSIDDNVVDSISSYTFNGKTITPTDKRMYREVSFVVAIRGRLQ